MYRLKLLQFKEKMQLLGYAERTITDYTTHTELFFRYLQEHENISTIKEIEFCHIQAYQNFLTFTRFKKGNHLMSKTISSRLLAVKTFFRIMHEEKLVPFNLGEKILMPKVRKRLPRNIPDEKAMRRLLESVEPQDPITTRDRAILELLYATGIRNQELRNLEVDDFDRSEKTLLIRHGKGDKDRVVPIGSWVIPYLLEYLEVGRAQLIKEKTALLFISKNGRQLTFGNLCALVHKYREQAGIETPITPHTFRHACATHMLKGGADIRYVQELLGHADLSSTQIYTKVAIGDLQEAHRKYHPRDKQDAD